MFKSSKSRKDLLFRLSAIVPICFFMSAGIYVYSTANAPTYPDEINGKVYSIYYKGKDLYITKAQYVLVTGLPIFGVISFGLMNIITSPKLGIFSFEDDN
jgi:hypothetical protein